MTTKNQLTPIGQICQTLDKMQPALNENLKGTGISTQRFLATAKTAVQTHADREKLSNADRQSLYLAIKKSASDGLMPDNREAALVIYNNQVQYQPMVQGLVKLARNSGEIESIGAYIVYANDMFTYRVGIDSIPTHEASGDDGMGWFSSSRGEPIGVWAYVKLKSGDYLEPVMLSRERVMRIAQRSRLRKNYNPGEGLDWEEFWKKAAIRNILKYAPRSTALDSALEKIDDEISFDSETGEIHEAPAKTKLSPKQTKASQVITDPEPDNSEIIDLEPQLEPEYEPEYTEEEIPV